MSLAGYSFSRGELTVGTVIYTHFTSITSDQPTEEGEPGMGASPYPLTYDEGSVSRGTFEIEWSDIGKRNECIEALDELARQQGVSGYRNAVFPISYVMVATGRQQQVIDLEGCRLLAEPDEASQGDLIGGQMSGTCAKKLINGIAPHG
jgi:hypothetical protein